jgi:hypothetical protein
MGLPSAYYNDSHRKWQKTCRALVDELLMVEGGEWERAGDVPGTLSSPPSPCKSITKDKQPRIPLPKIRRRQLPNPQSLSPPPYKMAPQTRHHPPPRRPRSRRLRLPPHPNLRRRNGPNRISRPLGSHHNRNSIRSPSHPKIRKSSTPRAIRSRFNYRSKAM